jgi:hypothetical protein
MIDAKAACPAQAATAQITGGTATSRGAEKEVPFMTNEQERPEEPRWLLGPPRTGEVLVYASVGEGARLTPAIQEALEQLFETLMSAETEGYMLNRRFVMDCLGLNCGGFRCTGFGGTCPGFSCTGFM